MRQLIAGEPFGNWTVLKEGQNNKERYWVVQCSCGAVLERRVSQLVQGKTSSCRTCAAKLREQAQRHYDKTGLSPHVLTLIKHRAKKKGIECSITFEDLIDKWKEQKGKCKFTGLPLFYKPHQRASGENTASVDRVDSTKGYVPGNIQWVHKTINFMKQGLSDEEFIYWCVYVSRHNSCGV